MKRALEEQMGRSPYLLLEQVVFIINFIDIFNFSININCFYYDVGGRSRIVSVDRTSYPAGTNTVSHLAATSHIVSVTVSTSSSLRLLLF